MEIVFDFKYEVDEVKCEIEQSPLCGNIDLVEARVCGDTDSG